MDTETISLFGRDGINVYSNRFNNLNDMFRHSVSLFAEKNAVVSKETALTFKELDMLSNQVGSYLQQELGILKGDRVAMVIGNRHYFPIVLFACSKIGATLIPVNVKLSSEEKEYIFSHSEIKAVICELEFEESVSSALEMSDTLSLPNDNLVVIDRDYENQRVFHYHGELKVEELNELDHLFILYTSGTTGKPKGAVLTHINVIHSLMNYQHIFQTHKDLKTIIAVPIFHVTGLVAQFLHLIYIGGTSYLMKKYQNKQYIDLTLEHQINFHFNVPTIFIMMSTTDEFKNHSFDFVERVAFGGSPIYKQTYEMLQKVFPNANLHNAYGSTETTSPATLMPAEYPDSKLNSVGKPVPVADIKIIGEERRFGD